MNHEAVCRSALATPGLIMTPRPNSLGGPVYAEAPFRFSCCKINKSLSHLDLALAIRIENIKSLTLLNYMYSVNSNRLLRDSEI